MEKEKSILDDQDLRDLRVPMDQEIIERLDIVKSFLGIKNTTDIIRFLITEKYRKIKKEMKDIDL